MIGLSFRDSRGDHVGVADGFDLFHCMFRGKAVEA